MKLGRTPRRPTQAALVTVRDRVRGWLLEHPHEPYCALCVATVLELPRHRVAFVFLMIEGETGFRREDIECKRCGSRRMALVYRPEGRLRP